MADPMEVVETALYGVMSGDAELASLAPGGVWNGIAPLHCATPYVSFSLGNQTDKYTFTGPYEHDFIYRVTAFDQSEDISAASGILARVFELLQDSNPSMTGYDMMYLRRAGRTRLQPSVDGVVFQQVIDAYQVKVTPE